MKPANGTDTCVDQGVLLLRVPLSGDGEHRVDGPKGEHMDCSVVQREMNS